MDIGDKSWGVTVCQKYFEKQSLNSGSSSKLQFGPENTLHVGDQFLSAGANDFRARSVGTTAWIASPEETVYVLSLSQSHRVDSTFPGGTILCMALILFPLYWSPKLHMTDGASQ